MFHAGDQIENPVTGERLVFHETSAETGGARVVFLTVVRPSGFVPAGPVHPLQTQGFLAPPGNLRLRPRQRHADPGPAAVITAGAWWEREAIEEQAPHGGHGRRGARSRRGRVARPGPAPAARLSVTPAGLRGRPTELVHNSPWGEVPTRDLALQRSP